MTRRCTLLYVFRGIRWSDRREKIMVGVRKERILVGIDIGVGMCFFLNERATTKI